MANNLNLLNKEYTIYFYYSTPRISKNSKKEYQELRGIGGIRKEGIEWPRKKAK